MKEDKIYLRNQGYVRCGCPLRGDRGVPKNIFLFYFPMVNIGSQAARATARVAPTGLHGPMCDRAAYALKQTICGGACASERCREQGGPETNITRFIVWLVSPPPPMGTAQWLFNNRHYGGLNVLCSVDLHPD